MIKLPDAITADHAPEVDEIYMAVDGMGLKGSYAAYAAGFNAAIEKVQHLNAAAQPVSDGWVKCSERMPVQHQSNRYVPLNLLLNERTVVQGGFDDGEFWMDGVVINNVTRWMPLPSVPGGQDD